jgi:hypothetical protein
LETQDFSVPGILAALRQGTELEQRYMSTRQTIRKTWNNWFRLRSKPRGARLARES